jgi:TubC N-terminal docking domain
MSAFDLIKHLQQSGIELGVDGEKLLASPKSALTDELREAIRSNKLALLEALGQNSLYWLIGDATVISSASPMTLAEVQRHYPGQTCKPLSVLPYDTKESGNTHKADRLRERIQTLAGRFYDQEDVVLALRWVESGDDLKELEKLIVDAEKQVAARVQPACKGCAHYFKVGLSDGGYCSSPDRRQAPSPYGKSHTARLLPSDGGKSCKHFTGDDY